MKRILSLFMILGLICSMAVCFALPISAATSGVTGACNWTLNGTVLTVSGSGAMGDYNGAQARPWGNTITKVVIEEGVTSIGHGAFSDCSFLFSVTIPESVIRIGAYAFEDTAYYNNAQNWTNGVLYIGNHLIDAASSLAGAYTIKAGTRSIAVYAFDSCTELTSVTVPESVSVIGDSAFFNCTGLTSVSLPKNLKAIDEGAFANCTKLTSVTIPESVTAIGAYAFYCCEKLKTVALPNGLETIGQQAFDTKLSGNDATLRVHENSVGYTYAKKNGHNVELTDDHTRSLKDGAVVCATCGAPISISGFQSIGGTNYLVKDGRLVDGEIATWSNGKTYLISQGRPAMGGAFDYQGKVVYVRTDGVFADGCWNVTNPQACEKLGIEPGRGYLFDNGVLIHGRRDTWVNGNDYYMDKGRPFNQGISWIDETPYYIISFNFANGIWTVSSQEVAEAFDITAGKGYLFENGRLVDGKMASWNGKMYYIVKGRPVI